ncbi:hypothetical protein JD969_10895 [Planctomycetota bacterium]|nr:hypothetical protein JD969_10895 [Planctomycetota bacterium]
MDIQYWISVILPFVSTLLGGGIAYFATMSVNKRKYELERQQVASAIAGEIASILKIVEIRKYYTDAEHMLENLRTNPGSVENIWVPAMNENYFIVFESNSGKLGMLPKNVAGRVVAFYTLCKSVKEDMVHSVGKDCTHEARKEAFEQFCTIFGEAIEIGNEVVQDLRGIHSTK